jgi:hypothetical protein
MSAYGQSGPWMPTTLASPSMTQFRTIVFGVFDLPPEHGSRYTSQAVVWPNQKNSTSELFTRQEHGQSCVVFVRRIKRQR